MLFRSESVPPTGLSRDVVLVHGIEPNMRWRAFSEELVQGLESLGVKMIILLGALLADAPHTRPVPVSIGSSDAKLGTEIGVGLSDYKGPTGIVGVLQHTCTQAGIPTLSLWAQVPHYVAQPPSPKATLALLRGVEDILDVPLPLADLPEEARAWERGVDELAQQDSEVADYVRTLEEAKDAMDLPEASGDAIAREFERYFRRHAWRDRRRREWGAEHCVQGRAGLWSGYSGSLRSCRLQTAEQSRMEYRHHSGLRARAMGAPLASGFCADSVGFHAQV